MTKDRSKRRRGSYESGRSDFKTRAGASTALAVGMLLVLAVVGLEEMARGSVEKKSRPRRGEYLVAISGCNDCHTPHILTADGPAPDLGRRLSGHPELEQLPAWEPSPVEGPWIWAGTADNTAFAGPWGTSYATNLTPDQDTGIGIWSEKVFIQAMRTGHHQRISRPIRPPMPWRNFAAMSDADLGAVFAYLATVPPVSNRVPDATPDVQ